MKEATGELSMTAVVVVIIGILAVALPLIINQLTKTMQHSANCAAAFGCETSACDNNTVMTCYYQPDGKNEDGSFKEPVTIQCPCSESEVK